MKPFHKQLFLLHLMISFTIHARIALGDAFDAANRPSNRPNTVSKNLGSSVWHQDSTGLPQPVTSAQNIDRAYRRHSVTPSASVQNIPVLADESGKATPIPIPDAVWLFLTGIFGVLYVSNRPPRQ